MIDISIIDGVPGSSFTADLPTLLPAFQAYANLVTEQWSLEAVTLHYAASVAEADPAMWWLVVNGHSPDPSMGGFHSEQPQGLPFARVYAGDAMRDGYSMTVDLTHELCEMLVDPYPETSPSEWYDGVGKTFLKEPGDPVESDAIAITVDGVLCSNFVLPNFYSKSQVGPFDYGRMLTKPCPAMVHGGYVSWIENYQWHQDTASLRDGTKSRRSERQGRSARWAAKRLAGL